jgi:hypothetical protein
MAVIYQHATITPSKPEMLRVWIPSQPWCTGNDMFAFEPVGAFRFDDPDGEVGIETHLIRASDGTTLQVPVTYRGSPLDNAEQWLIAVAEHSVLGTRWVYDACGDPVYVKALATTILCGGNQAELDVVTDGGQERRESSTRVLGTGRDELAPKHLGTLLCTSDGSTSVIRVDDLELIILRTIDPSQDVDAQARPPCLVGTWPGQDEPSLLAVARKV